MKYATAAAARRATAMEFTRAAGPWRVPQDREAYDAVVTPELPQLPLRIVLEQPPPGIDFGVQKGRGSIYETIQTQRSAGRDLAFDFTVTVKAMPAAGPIDVGGDIVQGPRGGRFVYIDIGTYAGQKDTPWSRRLKIPLTGITSDLVRRALARPGGMLEARLPGTGRDGGPSCASPRDFAGWTLAR